MKQHPFGLSLSKPFPRTSTAPFDQPAETGHGQA